MYINQRHLLTYYQMCTGVGIVLDFNILSTKLLDECSIVQLLLLGEPTHTTHVHVVGKVLGRPHSCIKS